MRCLAKTGRGDSIHDNGHPSLVFDISHHLSKRNIRCMGRKDIDNQISMRFPWKYGATTKDKELADLVGEFRRKERRAKAASQQRLSGGSPAKVLVIHEKPAVSINSGALTWDERYEEELGFNKKENDYILSFEDEKDRENIKLYLMARRRWIEEVNESAQTAFLSDETVGDTPSLSIEESFQECFGFGFVNWNLKFPKSANSLKCTLANMAYLFSRLRKSLGKIIPFHPTGTNGREIAFWINHAPLLHKIISKDNIKAYMEHLVANGGLDRHSDEINSLRDYVEGDESAGSMRDVSDVIIQTGISAWNHIAFLIDEWYTRNAKISSYLRSFLQARPGSSEAVHANDFVAFDDPLKIPVELANEMEQLGSHITNILNLLVGGSTPLWAVYICSNNKWDLTEQVRELIFAC